MEIQFLNHNKYSTQWDILIFRINPENKTFTLMLFGFGIQTHLRKKRNKRKT